MAKKILIGAVAFYSLSVANPSLSQATKDQIAYNYVFDRLNFLFPDTPSEDVHLLNVLVPATWADLDNHDASVELQSIAGSIPDDVFALDPSRMKIRLDLLYSDYITQADLPALTPADAANLQKARDDFTTATTELRRLTGEYDDLWRKHASDLKNEGKPLTSGERQRFQRQHGGMFTSVNGKLNDAITRISRYSDANEKWRTAATLLNNQLQGVNTVGDGVYPYRGGAATLRAISADCLDDETKGWEELSFSNSTSSQNFRSSSWNGSGGWDTGGFFGVSGGGGRSSYENLVKTASDNVSLQFCNLSYIRFEPGPWFDITFLQAIDEGKVKLKPGALNYGKPVFGKRGVIPHLVKGAIVARRVKFLATSDESMLREVQSVSGGSGGFRVGGWRLGGSASRVKFDREYSAQGGRYGRSSNTEVPVIIAIVTEATKGSGDLPLPEDGAAPVAD